MLRINTKLTTEEIDDIHAILKIHGTIDLPINDEPQTERDQIIAAWLRQEIATTVLKDSDYHWFMCIAATVGATDILRHLKEKNNDLVNRVINQRDDRGLTPLAIAVASEQIEAIDFFLDETNADINWHPITNPFGNLLEFAITREAVKSLAHLIRRSPALYASSNQPIESERPPYPLIVMANAAQSIKALTWLLTEGPEKGLREQNDETGIIVGIAVLGKKFNALKTLTEIAPKLFHRAKNPLSPNEQTPIITLIRGEDIRDHRLIVLLLENNIVSSTEIEIKFVFFYFTWYFKNLIAKHNKGENFLLGKPYTTNQEKFSAFFNLLLKYSSNCPSLNFPKPEMLQNLERLASDYALINSSDIQLTYCNIPKTFWIKIIAARANITIDETYPAKYPLDLLESYLNTEPNLDWQTFVSKIANIKVEANDSTSCNSTSLIFSNMRRSAPNANNYLSPSVLDSIFAEVINLSTFHNCDLPIAEIKTIINKYSATLKTEQTMAPAVYLQPTSQNEMIAEVARSEKAADLPLVMSPK